MTPDSQSNIDNLSKSIREASDQQPVQTDIVRELQTEIFTFVSQHIARTASVYELRSKVQAKIETNLEQNAYSPQEVIALYKMLTQETAIGTDMLVSLFKPAPGVESFLARNLSEDHSQKDKDKATADLLKTTSPDMMQKIDSLIRWMADESTTTPPAEHLTVVEPALTFDAKIPTPWSDDEEEVPDA